MSLTSDFEKIKIITHYIIYKAKPPKNLGGTQLYKIFWFADCINYLKFGESITAQIYIKDKYGPVPRSVEVALIDLESENKISRKKINYFRKDKWEYKSLKEPLNINSVIKPQGLKILNSCFSFVINKNNAKSISEITHTDIFNRLPDGGQVPFFACFVSKNEKINELASEGC